MSQATSKAIPIGVVCTLTIARFSDHGAYLKVPDSGDLDSRVDSQVHELGTPKSKSPNPKPARVKHNLHKNTQKHFHEILLPKKFCLDNAQVGQNLEVFTYTDSLDRPVATTSLPLAQLGDIVALRVVSHAEHGVFLDLGLEKDIFMPTKSPANYALGSLVVVWLGLDKAGRLIAKKDIESKLKPYKPHKKAGFYRGKKVSILPYSLSALGLSCVVENRYYGLLYAPRHTDFGVDSKADSNTTRRQLDPSLESSGMDSSTKATQTHFARAGFTIGEMAWAFIHKVRADGKLDLTSSSAKDTQSDEQKILRALYEHGGSLALHYDSPPESIQALLGISKKSLKRALTKLLAQKRITLTPNVGIHAL